MGTVAPNPFYTEEIARECMEKIFMPTVAAMNAEGRRFRGCLYFGLMLTKDGPKVIEYNCRFGDPETQVVLPLLESDLLTVMMKTTAGTLKPDDVRFGGGAACCVIMASGGYPGSYEKGFEIRCGDMPEGVDVFFAGAKRDGAGGKLVTSGGRVLGVTATAGTLREAVDRAYGAVPRVTFSGAFFRRDIGKRALSAPEAGK